MANLHTFRERLGNLHPIFAQVNGVPLMLAARGDGAYTLWRSDAMHICASWEEMLDLLAHHAPNADWTARPPAPPRRV